jgi:hypothetical protein
VNIEAAVIFLAGSILLSVSLIVLGLSILFLNNVFCRYWKPFKVAVFHNVVSEKTEVNVEKKEK